MVSDKTKGFIQKAKKIHKDEYDYSFVEYVNAINKVIIICFEHGPFEQSPNAHLAGKGCSNCGGVGRKDTSTFITEATKIHGDKYDYSKVKYLSNANKVIIRCQEHGPFEQTPSTHLNGSGCPICGDISSNKKRSLTTNEFITKAIKVHNTDYDYSKTNYINAYTKIVVICPEHGEFLQNPYVHLEGSGCPSCGGKEIRDTKSFIEKANRVHKNRYNYSKVTYVNSQEKVTIICSEHGEFFQKPNNHISGYGCLNCTGKEVRDTKSFIEKAIKIHGNRYDYSKINYSKSDTKVIIICPDHGEFLQKPNGHLNGTGCPVCNKGFVKTYQIKLLNDLQNSDLLSMDPIQLLIIIQQGKLPISFIPLTHTDAGSEERIATIDELREHFETDEEEEITEVTTTPDPVNQIDRVDEEITTTEEVPEPTLPILSQTQCLHSLDNAIYAGMDEEAFQSLIQYELKNLWNKMLNNKLDLASLRNESGGKYFAIIKNEFLKEYEEVSILKPSKGYSFRGGNKNGPIIQPLLMQQLTQYRLMKNKSYGNWSGTGAGKTLSFILASRAMDARLTIVIVLNSVVDQICNDIRETYPDSICKTSYHEGYVFDRKKHNYLVLNYEKFQQKNNKRMFESLTENNQIDFVVLDEVHNAKQREEEIESQRRMRMISLLGRARQNDNLHVLAMSATPVINNLQEAKSLLSLMTGLEYKDLETTKSLQNALKVFQQLILNGLRYIPDYKINITELTSRNRTNLNIDGNHLLQDILDLPKGDTTAIEKLLLPDKLKYITPYLKKGVIMYSLFTDGVIIPIKKYVQSLGFKVGTYTGLETTETRERYLKDFIHGRIDILIGSKPIGTAVNGLQKVCNRIICMTLPWTDADYTQLKGRIFRQGSIFNDVEIIIPQVRIDMDEGNVWSWDMQRLNLIKNKKTLADVAVDGIIPSRIMPSRETLYRKSIESLKLWQDRVAAGNLVSIERNRIELYPEIESEEERIRRRNSELQEFNRVGKTTRSATMHERFKSNPDSWYRYHAIRKESMESWDERPYEVIATKIKDRNDIIADFGCGENLFKTCVPNSVLSFDHVAIDDTVTACDMKDTGLADESINVAVFSLALWGTNCQDYIKEAYRALRWNGRIYIAEPADNYQTPEDQQKLINMINAEGFKQVGEIENRGKFVYLTGIKI